MALARLEHNTLLIDADIGLRNLDLLLGLENRIIYTGVDVLNKTCRLEQALIQDKRQQKLTFFPLSSSQSKTPITKSQIQELINLVEEKYDFILIDSPAGIDEGFQTALDPANEALIIVTPEVPSIRDADKVIGILLANGIKNNKLVINRIRPQMVKSDDMMSVSDVKNILGIPILGIIPDDEQVIIASNRGEPLVLEDNLSLPGLAFENAARRLDGQIVEFLDLEKLTTNPVKRMLGNFLTRRGQKT
jgi:septum site-determining protein MinD